MGMFWEFFTFELRFRIKSISTYVYFLLWFAFSFFCVASESFGPLANSNGKVLLNGPFGNSLDDAYCCLFGVIVIEAFGSRLRFPGPAVTGVALTLKSIGTLLALISVALVSINAR